MIIWLFWDYFVINWLFWEYFVIILWLFWKVYEIIISDLPLGFAPVWDLCCLSNDARMLEIVIVIMFGAKKNNANVNFEPETT